MSSTVSKTVAVIGAGAAGLCAALELRREGHKVVIYERDTHVGGTWHYTPETETDPTQKVIHSSLYASLRTNLPREIMGFRVYPFLKPGKDPRRFPGHAEVKDYLTDFAQEFHLEELIRFGEEVMKIELTQDQKWMVRSRGNEEDDQQVYDAIVVCNGHYTQPRFAKIPGIDAWPGKQIHSHNYRIPDPFRDQVVVMIGNSFSSSDISRDISTVAKQVHVASRSDEIRLLGKLVGHDNIWMHSMIESVHEDGLVVFEDQIEIHADAIIHCTGYEYSFPFLETNGVVRVEDNRVGPLFKHVFPPTLAPWLSFVGLPWKVVPLPMFEYQCKWIAGVLSGRIPLPTTEEMMSDIEVFYSLLDASHVPKRYTHRMSNDQFEYIEWVAAQCGCPPMEDWRKQIACMTNRRMSTMPDTYRDHWDDQHLIPPEFNRYGFI